MRRPGCLLLPCSDVRYQTAQLALFWFAIFSPAIWPGILGDLLISHSIQECHIDVCCICGFEQWLDSVQSIWEG